MDDITRMDSNTLNNLITKCKSGQADAFDELIDLYGNRCFGFFYRLSGSREIAEDLLSELFVKLTIGFLRLPGICSKIICVPVIGSKN
jgi:DNA-directed RNA polymerase specialized sigma24 family protein